MKFEVEVNVMPLKVLLDPQGKAVRNAVQQLGYTAVEDVRVGKRIIVQVEVDSEQEALRLGNELAEKLLSNPVMEGYECSVRSVDVK